MPLRLAGQAYLTLQGTDPDGWVREITVNNTTPGLKINQQGTGRVFDFQDGGASKLYLPDGGNVTLAGSVVFDLVNDVTITPTNPAAPRTLTIPAGGGNRTFSFLDEAQTFTALQTFNSGIDLGGNTLDNPGGTKNVWNATQVTMYQDAEPLTNTAVPGNYSLYIARGDIAAASSNGESSGIGFTADNGQNNIGAAIIFAADGAQSRGQLRFYTKPNEAGGGAIANAMTLTRDKDMQLYGYLYFQQASTIQTSAGDLTLNPAGKVALGSAKLITGWSTQTTVGAAGAASALPANPTGYAKIDVGGTTYVVPYYAAT